MSPGPLPDPPADLTDGVVRLRRARPDDAEAIARAAVDPDIVRWTRVPEDYTVDMAREFIAGHQENFDTGRAVNLLAVDATTDELIASIGYVHLEWPDLVGEIGYWTAPWMRRRGLTARAVRLCAGWGFSVLGLQKVECWIATGNPASAATALAAGFTREGTLRAAILDRNGNRPDMTIYGLLAEEP